MPVDLEYLRRITVHIDSAGIASAVRRAVDEIEVLRTENADLRKALHDRYDTTAVLIAERDELLAEVDGLKAEIDKDLEIYNSRLDELKNKIAEKSEFIIRRELEHDARVTELLEANNREVERRRRAEAAMRTPSPDPRTQGWFLFAVNNADAMQALIEGRAAVVPLHFVNVGMNYIVYGGCNSIPLCNVRLDKPMEDK